MQKTITILAFLTASVAGSAQAEEGCFVPMSNWKPREAVVKLAEERSWDVRRIKIDDGCYEIKGRDAEGREIEVKLQPDTLQIVEFEFEEEHEDDRRDDESH